MKIPSVIFTLLLAIATPGHAQTRIALVDSQKIYDSYPTAQQLKERIAAAKQEIEDSPISVKYKTAVEEMKTLMEQIKNLSERIKKETNTNNQQKLDELKQQYEVKLKATQSLRQEFANYREKRMQEINQNAVIKIRQNLNDIQTQAQAVAERLGYDLVFDVSGDSNSGVPFVLYAKRENGNALPNDITEEVSKALGTHDSPAPRSTDTAEPEATTPNP